MRACTSWATASARSSWRPPYAVRATSPVAPPRPVASLFLAQGAVSLWAFAAGGARALRRRTGLLRRRRHFRIRVGTDRRDEVEMGLRGREVLPARGEGRRTVPARGPPEVRRYRHIRHPGRPRAAWSCLRSSRARALASISNRTRSTTSTRARSSTTCRGRLVRTTTSPIPSCRGSAGDPRSPRAR